MKRYLLTALISSFFVTCGVLFSLIVFWLVVDARVPVYEVYSHPVPVAGPSAKRSDIINKPTARQGESVYIYRESCWTRIMKGVIKRSLLQAGKAVFIFEVIPIGNLKIGCQGIAGVLKLPEIIPVGNYTLVATMEFNPNPLTHIDVTWGDVTIEVVP